MLLKDEVFFSACNVLLPLEEEEVHIVVVLCKEVAQNAVWVATFDLIGRQAKVDALHKVPELSYRILVEPPEEKNERRRDLGEYE